MNLGGVSSLPSLLESKPRYRQCSVVTSECNCYCSWISIEEPQQTVRLGYQLGSEFKEGIQWRSAQVTL